MDTSLDEESPRARLALLLKHFSELKDNREPGASSIRSRGLAGGDLRHDRLLRRFRRHRRLGRAPSRLPAAFPSSITAFPARAGCAPSSTASIRSCSAAASTAGSPRSGRTGTTSSPSTARRHAGPMTARKGLKALHTLSAYATTARLTLAQLSVPEKTNEITAIPELLRPTRRSQPARRRARHHRRHGLPSRDRRQDRCSQGRLPAPPQGQPTHARSRGRSAPWS